MSQDCIEFAAFIDGNGEEVKRLFEKDTLNGLSGQVCAQTALELIGLLINDGQHFKDSCGCYKDLLLMLRKSCETDFWKVVRWAFGRSLNPLEPAEKKMKMNAAVKADSRTFLTEKPDYENSHQWKIMAEIAETEKVKNAELTNPDQIYVLENILTVNFIQSQKSNFDESKMREVVRLLFGLSRFWVIPRPDKRILLAFSDLFFQNLNKKLSATNEISVTNMCVIPQNVEDFLEFRRKGEKSSFKLFLDVLEENFKTASEMNRFSCKILSKITSKKLKELNDVGWTRLFAFINVMVNKFTSVLNSWTHLLLEFSFDNRSSVEYQVSLYCIY